MSLLLLLALALGPAWAQDRPDEGSLFGLAESTAAAPGPRDDAGGLRGLSGRDAFASGEVKDNPLQIGGVYYQRWTLSKQQGQPLSQSPMAMPLQFDAFMDSRPSDRLRGYVRERIVYDPTLDQFSNPTKGRGFGGQQLSSTSGAPQSLPGGTASALKAPNNPQTVLDQAWLKLDVERRVFITAGKQHVKWGASRFWNPTDFLNTQRRDPLLPYDLRLGADMLKLELPLRRKGTNLYALALFDNPVNASTAGQLGAAFRGETLLGDAEVGVEALYRGGVSPIYGADLSAPLGPFDVYAEGALLTEAPAPRYTLLNASPSAGTDLSSLYGASTGRGAYLQASAGGSWSFSWKENRRATLGAEYFYNQLGYGDGHIYPILIFLGQYQPFYAGRHYGALYLTAEGPDEGKRTNYTFSLLSNLSDETYLGRVDFSWRVLTYLTFEAYADDHFGTRGGEFNFALNTPALTSQGSNIPALNIPATTYDLGLGLRLSF